MSAIGLSHFPAASRIDRQVTELSTRRFTVEEYHQLVETGILKSGDPYELVDGLILQKMTIHPPHASAVSRLAKWMIRSVPDEWDVRVQQPIALSTSEPEPDLTVVSSPQDRYDDRHPGPREISLIIEVADHSLVGDQEIKLLIYAMARIPVYWIVNLVDHRVEVYTLPRAGRSPTYRARTDFQPGETIPVVLANKEIGRISVDDILP